MRHPVQVLFPEENVDGSDLKLRLPDHQQVLFQFQDGSKHRIGLHHANKYHVSLSNFYTIAHAIVKVFSYEIFLSLPHLLP